VTSTGAIKARRTMTDLHRHRSESTRHASVPPEGAEPEHVRDGPHEVARRASPAILTLANEGRSRRAVLVGGRPSATPSQPDEDGGLLLRRWPVPQPRRSVPSQAAPC